MHAGEGGIDGAALDARDFLEGQASVHAEPEDLALLDGELRGGGLDLLSEVAAGSFVGGGEGGGGNGLGAGFVERTVGFFTARLVDDGEGGVVAVADTVVDDDTLFALIESGRR